MARPQKNSCDYFTHDNDMRNHRKVKSIRNKFGIQGYAIWSMLLEYLTGIDGNEFEYSDLEFELISGDFGVSVTEIRDVVDYCIKLEMLFNNNSFIYSESLNQRLHNPNIKSNIEHWNWKGGITSENKKIRNSPKMKAWIKKVYSRDNYTCQKCNKKSGKLNAHHINPFSTYPSLRFEISNGITLCKSCHIELHKNDRY